MNRKMVFYTLGRIMLVIAALLLLPTACAAYFKETTIHAPYPVREAAPEQKTFTHHFNIFEDRRARCGKAAYGFKKSVNVRRYLMRDKKRQRAYSRCSHPRERDYREALFGKYDSVFCTASKCQRKPDAD